MKVKDCEEPLPKEGLNPESRWGMVFDGAVNAYGKRFGVVNITPHGSHIPFTARLAFDCTNNMEEYEACIMGLEEAIDLRIKILDVYRDSTLVINHIKGEWDTHHIGLIPYKDYARRLSPLFNKIEFHHIPGDENQMEDSLATLASMYLVNAWNDVPLIIVRCLDRTDHVFATEDTSNEKPWYYDIKYFLHTEEYPLGASNKDRKTLRRMAGSFFLNEDVCDTVGELT